MNFKEGLAFYSSIGILQVRGRERERELAGMQHFLELVVALIYVYLSQDRFDSSYLYIYIYMRHLWEAPDRSILNDGDL